MSNTNTGGPAFPTPRYERGDMYSLGMTLRDYFAAKWLQGFMANPALDDLTPDLAACKAYQIADAMLKARQA